MANVSVSFKYQNSFLAKLEGITESAGDIMTAGLAAIMTCSH